MIEVKMSNDAFATLDIRALEKFCSASIGEGRWKFRASADTFEYQIFLFETNEDALAFKLRFEL